MRALVTGGTGFVGYHVIRELIDHGYEVRAMVRRPTTANALLALGASVVEGDLTTGEGILNAVNDCEAIFHVAAHYSLNRRDGAVMLAANVDGTRRMLEAVRKAGGPRLIYTSSTAAVALRADGAPAVEATGFVHPNRTFSDYKRSKVLAEALVREAARDGMDIVIVNPSTPVGPNDVKPTPTGKIIWDTMHGKMPAYVDTGLNMVAVEDVAAGHRLAFERGRTGERYILGHQNMHLADLLRMISRIAGRRAPRVKLPFWLAMTVAMVDDGILSPMLGKSPRAPISGVKLAKTPMYFCADKAVHELGMPQTSVEEAIRRAVDWFARHSVD